MKYERVFVFGLSTVDPNFFSRNVLGKEQRDPGCFVDLVSQLAECEDTRVFPSNCSGNEWLSSCIIDQLDNMTSNTLVIVQWSTFDLFDVIIDGSLTNDEVGVYDKQMLHERTQRNKEFFNTVNFDGLEKKQGLRFWRPGPTQKHPSKNKHFKNILLNNAYGTKLSCEKISLVQKLLKERNIQQHHFTAIDVKSLCYSYVKLAVQFINQPTAARMYKYMPFRDSPVHIDELEKWYRLIDYTNFTNSYISFFAKHGIPYWPTPQELSGPFHQPPINNYIFLKTKIFNNAGTSFFDRATLLNDQHCDLFSIDYDERVYDDLKSKFKLS